MNKGWCLRDHGLGLQDDMTLLLAVVLARPALYEV